jgi:hypothetical protein
LTNYTPQPLPHFWEQTEALRPGVRSIADAFFTFRLIDLWRHPSIKPNGDEYPLGRTSVPSMLYARGHSLHYDYFPPILRSDAAFVHAITRATIIIALPLTLLMLVELTRRSLVSLTARGDQTSNSLLFTVAGVGFIAFQAVYAIRYRDFSTVKAIFLFPALPAFVAAFVGSVERFVDRFGESSLSGRAVQFCITWLPLLYLSDVLAALVGLVQFHATAS